MHLLKSLFISGYVTALIIGSVYALFELARGGSPILSWFGMALATLAPLSFFAWLYTARPARTARHPVPFSVVGGLGVAITLALSYRFEAAAGNIHLWSGLALIGWFAYLRWYSPFTDRETGPLTPGKPLPEFTLENTDGELVNSRLFRGRPHVLVFYRGNWCPICSAQVHELAEHYAEFKAQNAALVFISPQGQNEQRKIARRLDLPLLFLRDRAGQAAKSLGIFAHWGTPMGLQILRYDSDTVLPTVVITDEHGVIVHADITDNYRIRPEPRALLEAFSKARA